MGATHVTVTIRKVRLWVALLSWLILERNPFVRLKAHC